MDCWIGRRWIELYLNDDRFDGSDERMEPGIYISILVENEGGGGGGGVSGGEAQQVRLRL